MLSMPANGKLIGRFRDWWHGDEEVLVDPSEAEPALDPATVAPEPEEPPAFVQAPSDGLAGGVGGRPWSAESIAAVQMVCGEGSSIPGGWKFAAESVKRIGLNDTMSVADYGCQLGLFARVMSKQSGAWVDAYEPVELLSAEATRLNRTAKQSKKINVESCELLKAPVKPRSRDVVVAVEVMHRSPERVAQLHNMARMLKPAGRLLVIDFFRETAEPSSPAIDNWRVHEVLQPGIPRVKHLTRAMEGVRLRLQSAENVSATYCENLTAGLRRLARQLTRHPPESAMHGAILAEVEFWGARLRVLQSGDIGVYRLIGSLPKS